VNPCLSDDFNKLPFCNVKLPIMERVEDAIGRMTLDEKISNLGSGAGSIKGLGLNSYNWWSEATHGISHNRNDARTPYETNFAFPITTAMSFNRSLWWSTGSQIGREGRALMNAGNAWSTFWAPVINLAREPRWGRNVETPGTHTVLTNCTRHTALILYSRYCTHDSVLTILHSP
jgi:beta-glucosidase-like glycosyl hydrolase